jgi:nucleotide-binding universal stress UspA family protein
MYKKIHVPIDNSDYSNQAVRNAIGLGTVFGSRMVGSHVYAARMHDYRFRQMEYTLPDEYLEETELDRQRKIHDSLITTGLQLISDSYLEAMRTACEEHQLEFEPRMMDGKHHTEIIRDINSADYDLTVIGVMGLGRVKDSQIGSVCERVARDSKSDVWVVKRLIEDGQTDTRDTILVGVDGSPQSFGALMTAIDLARKLNKNVEAISVYDPYLHYTVFNSVVNVLTEKAAKVFRFEEQNQLHEEIIDCGLAQIYQSHLDVAHSLAEEHGVEIRKTLLDGKAFQKILDHARKTDPWLLVIGRIGVHSTQDDTGLGSNTENLLRSCPCDVLLTTRLVRPELDLRAEESIRWTPEAEKRMERVPEIVRGIARTSIYRLAVEKGHSVITSDLLDDAMDRYMPTQTATDTARLAEALAIEKAQRESAHLCKTCGVTAFGEAIRCSVCGGTKFEVVTPEMLDKIASLEGGLEIETTYDGRKLKWTQEAKRALWTMKDAYKRRRAKARIEKSARLRKLPTVTFEFTRKVVEEETGEPLVLADAVADDQTVPPNGEDNELKLVARDAKKTPLLSAHTWSPEAVERLFLVPAGYMRDQTQRRAETLARENERVMIELTTVEQGIEIGRRMMEELLASPSVVKQPADSEKGDASICPFKGIYTGGAVPDEHHATGANGKSNGDTGGELYLNEVGILSTMMERRRKLEE